MSDLPVLPIWVTKYEGNTAHLSLEEDGAYTRLLRLLWRTPGCSVPADPSWIMRFMRVDEATFTRVVKPILDEFFERVDGRWHSQKLTEIYQDAEAKTKRRQAAGAKGGKAKALKTQETASSNATAKLEQCSSKPEPKPEPYIEDGGVVVAGEPENEFEALEANCRTWANGSLNLMVPGTHDLSPIVRLLNPSGGQPCTIDDVRNGIVKAAASLHRRGEQVKSFGYFEQPIIRERDKRLAPLPEPETSHGRQQRQPADGAPGRARGASNHRDRRDFGVVETAWDEVGAWSARAGVRVEDRYEDDVIDGAPLDAQRRAS